MKKIGVVVLLLCSCLGLAQVSPEKGDHEVQVWAGGGHSISGGVSRTGIFNLGLRYGWVLTDPHGLGFLKGRLEYAVDAVPMFLVFQPANTAYGFGVNPLVLKWNFVRRASVVPYFELGSGPLITMHDVPSGTSSVNFASSAALGFHRMGKKITWGVDVRYMHISNAGLAKANPGINTLQVRLGLGTFSRRR